VVEFFENVIEVILMREIHLLETPKEPQSVVISVILQNLAQCLAKDDFISKALSG
jgi:hypothetical protein